MGRKITFAAPSTYARIQLDIYIFLVYVVFNTCTFHHRLLSLNHILYALITVSFFPSLPPFFPPSFFSSLPPSLPDNNAKDAQCRGKNFHNQNFHEERTVLPKRKNKNGGGRAGGRESEGLDAIASDHVSANRGRDQEAMAPHCL